MPKPLQKIELDKVFIEQLTPQLILVTTKDSSILEVEDLKRIKEYNKKLTKGLRYGVISDAGNHSSVSKESREYMSTKGMEENRIATAYIINNLSQKLLLSFFLRINKPKVPSKSFSNIKDAREWIDKEINQA